jgi:hypothetical protein
MFMDKFLYYQSNMAQGKIKGRKSNNPAHMQRKQSREKQFFIS